MTESKSVIEQLPECDQKNVKFLMALFNSRLQCVGDYKVQDKDGNVVQQRQSLYKEKDVVNWLIQSLSAFNTYPLMTYYKFSDSEFVSYFSDLLVGYAAYLACSSQALKEAGVAQDIAQDIVHALQNKANQELISWENKIILVKQNDIFNDEWVKDPSDKDEDKE